jgi:Co/Zn/Cd efflux system component
MGHHHTDHDLGQAAHGHDQGEGHGHTHAHGIVDPSIASSDRGLWALKWSFVGLMVTAAIQTGVVLASGSVALLADTIHNFADAATAIPLGVAFWLVRRGATPRFTYGLGRVEDLAGLAIIVTILASAIAATYAAIHRLLHPEPVTLLWAVMVASIIGFVGNEAVAIFRIRVGRQIGSAALIADGYHARIDGWTSLAVLVGAIAVACSSRSRSSGSCGNRPGPSSCGRSTASKPRRFTRSSTPPATCRASRKSPTCELGGSVTGCTQT